jgi:hypothetical protein
MPVHLNCFKSHSADHRLYHIIANGCKRPILDLKVATIARDVAQPCATFRDFPRLCLATLRDFRKIIANDCKTSIYMTSFFFVARPSATFRDFRPQL